jgi:hypothetical protein
MNRYEILPGLPPYGPMYVNIPERTFSGEGKVIRFYKADGTSWVANFGGGIFGLTQVFDFPERNRLLVIVNGGAYLINPEVEREIEIFGGGIGQVIESPNGNLLCATETDILIIDTGNWHLWRSERISWDGIKDLKLERNILSGMSFDPTNSVQPWSPFSLNIETKEILGGSYRDMLDMNPHVRGKLLG